MKPETKNTLAIVASEEAKKDQGARLTSEGGNPKTDGRALVASHTAAKIAADVVTPPAPVVLTEKQVTQARIDKLSAALVTLAGSDEIVLKPIQTELTNEQNKLLALVIGEDCATVQNFALGKLVIGKNDSLPDGQFSVNITVKGNVISFDKTTASRSIPDKVAGSKAGVGITVNGYPYSSFQAAMTALFPDKVAKYNKNYRNQIQELCTEAGYKFEVMA